MKRLNIFLITIIVSFAAGCSSNVTSNSDENSTACLGDQCISAECVDQKLLRSKDDMLDFCQSPAFGTFSIEKDGIRWNFGESVSYGQFVNGDYWVLDKGDGVKITKVSPGPSGGRNGSMINPSVGSQAYDSRIKYYDSSQLVTFPATLKAGDSLVSTVSVSSSDLNSKGLISPSWYYMARGMNPNHARIKNASVLTVVSKVPDVGSFRPPYIGTEKKIFNVNNINRNLLKGYPAPSSLPDVQNLERGLERVWLMHLRGWTNREMHPVENMHNYYRDIGDFLSKASLVLLTDKVTPKLLNSFIQTGIDQYYTIKSGYGSRATYEFQTILTGLLLSDSEIANVWAEGRSKTPGRVSGKFYYVKDRENSIKSSVVPEGQTWMGFNVGFTNYTGQEHEHLHPSEWHKVVTEGGAKKTEVYRHCCNSIPWFGMGLASRGFKANSYWPNQAFNDYIDRWVWESKNGYGLDVIQKYYPSFYPEWKGNGSRSSLLGSAFLDDMYLTMGFSPNVTKPTHDPKTVAPEPLPASKSESESKTESVTSTGSSGGSDGEVSSKGTDAIVTDEGASDTTENEATPNADSSSQSDASQDEEIVYSDVYKAERSLQKAYNADIKARRAVYNADSKARREAYNAEKAALTAAYENGSLSRAEFITQRRALRAEFIAQRSAKRAEFKAAKAARRALLDADNAALLQQFNSGGSNTILDTRSLPANN